jgi:exosortase O
MLHVPLGVLGFIGTCMAALYLLGRTGQKADPARTGETHELRQPAWLGPLLLVTVVAMALLYTPRPAESAETASGPGWDFPEQFHATPVQLTPQELTGILQDGAERADRFAFEWDNGDLLANNGQPVRGTVMLVTSQTWRGQHQPERCFQVFGLTIDESFTYLAAPDFPVRHLSLSAQGAPVQVSAVYWLQSANQTTEDYSQRIWADLSPDRERWVLVTALFDRSYFSSMPDLDAFLISLHGAVGSSLTKGSVQ